MVTVAQLQRKAENRYRDVLKDLLRGNQPFPLRIGYPRLKTSGNLQELRRSMHAIKSQSKASLNFGYTVEWQDVETRKFGRNEIPGEIGFVTAEDFFGYLGKEAEVAEILGAAAVIRERYPAASDWVVGNDRLLLGRKPGFWENVFEVIDYLKVSPMPDLFTRELPVRVPTKFIENNQAVIESLLRTVAPESYRADGETFEERLGLRSPESLIEVRLLDSRLAPTLPLTHFTAAASQMDDGFFEGVTGVLVTENRLTFLTLPSLPGLLAILGQGYAITRLRRLPWLANHPLYYWGDIDVEGFEILATLRRIFPHTQALLMNQATLDAHGEYMTTGSGKIAFNQRLEEYLSPEEKTLARRMAGSQLRLEQERIPLDCLATAIFREGRPAEASGLPPVAATGTGARVGGGGSQDSF